MTLRTRTMHQAKRERGTSNCCRRDSLGNGDLGHHLSNRPITQSRRGLPSCQAGGALRALWRVAYAAPSWSRIFFSKLSSSEWEPHALLRPESRSVDRRSGFGERRRVSHRDEQWTGRKDVMIKSKPSEFHCTAPFNLKLKFSTGWFLPPSILANV